MATVTTEHPSAAGPPAGGPEGGPGWRKRWPIAAGAVALLVVIVLLWLVFGHDSGPSGGDDRGDTAGDLVVPSVVGMPAADAQRVLEAKGLTVATEQETQSRVGTHGMVIRQKPGPLAYASAGDKVTLVIGHEDIAVPDLANTPVPSAVDALTARNLAPIVAPAPADSAYASGLVASLSPAAGTVLAPGAQVTIVPASGYTTVPDLRRMCLADARTTLQAAGLQLGTVTETIDNDTIYTYDPAAWTNAAHTSVEASGFGRVPVTAPVLVYVTPNSGC